MAGPGSAVFDDAMLQFGGQGYTYIQKSQAIADSDSKPAQPLRMDDFLSAVSRPMREVKNTWYLFDDVHGLAGLFDMDAISRELGNSNRSALPTGIKPAAAVPANARLQLVIQPTGTNLHWAVKLWLFDDAIPTADAEAMSTGNASTGVFRKGPWIVKKAVHHLYQRIPGARIDYVVLEKRSDEDGPTSS